MNFKNWLKKLSKEKTKPSKKKEKLDRSGKLHGDKVYFTLNVESRFEPKVLTVNLNGFYRDEIQRELGTGIGKIKGSNLKDDGYKITFGIEFETYGGEKVKGKADFKATFNVPDITTIKYKGKLHKIKTDILCYH
jgi:hypothetical protein